MPGPARIVEKPVRQRRRNPHARRQRSPPPSAGPRSCRPPVPRCRWLFDDGGERHLVARRDGRVRRRADAAELYPGVHHGFAFPQRWCYDKPAAERHWERSQFEKRRAGAEPMVSTTLRWRKPDSKSQSRVTRPRSQDRLTSPLLIAANEK